MQLKLRSRRFALALAIPVFVVLYVTWNTPSLRRTPAPAMKTMEFYRPMTMTPQRVLDERVREVVRRGLVMRVNESR